MGIGIYIVGLSTAFYLIFAGFFLLDIMPALIVHVQYLIKNSGVVLTVDASQKKLTFDDKGHLTEVQFSDLTRLIRVASYGSKTGVYSFGNYRYYKLILKDGSQFIVTCLLINKIEENLISLLNFEEEMQLKLVAFI